MLHLLKKAPAMPALLLSSDSPKLREAYNRIRTNLDARLRGIACPVVGVSSPGEGEGAAACCENLAVSFARLGRRVLLIDADLRAEVPPALLSRPEGGLCERLAGEQVLPLSVEVCDTLWILPRGHAEGNPTDLLGGPAFLQVLRSLAEGYDMMFVSLPSVNGYADACAASSAMSGMVLAVAAGYTDRRRAADALNALYNVRATLLGTVAVDR